MRITSATLARLKVVKHRMAARTKRKKDLNSGDGGEAAQTSFRILRSLLVQMNHVREENSLIEIFNQFRYFIIINLIKNNSDYKIRALKHRYQNYSIGPIHNIAAKSSQLNLDLLSHPDQTDFLIPKPRACEMKTFIIIFEILAQNFACFHIFQKKCWKSIL